MSSVSRSSTFGPACGGRVISPAPSVQRHRAPLGPSGGWKPHAVGFGDAQPRELLQRRGMIEPARQILQALMQRAAEGDVQLLQPAADRQHRQAGLERGADQRQGHGVALRILGRALGMRRAVIERGLHVGAAAGEDQPIEPRDQGGDIGGAAVRGHQHRNAADQGIDGADIGVRGGVVGRAELAESFGAAGYADQRFHRFRPLRTKSSSVG